MALTKEVKYDKTEIVGDEKAIQCREVTIVKEDGVVLGRSYQRHVLHPSTAVKNADGTFTHTDSDISDEPAETQAVCAAVWTDAVKAAWAAHCETNETMYTRA